MLAVELKQLDALLKLYEVDYDDERKRQDRGALNFVMADVAEKLARAKYFETRNAEFSEPPPIPPTPRTVPGIPVLRDPCHIWTAEDLRES